MKYQLFENERRKIESIWNKFRENIKDISNISSLDFSSFNKDNIKSPRKFEIDTTPTIYDVYNWTGITTTNDPDVAVPEDFYELDNTGFYNFIFPQYGYRVLEGEEPEGDDWEFQTKIAVVDTHIDMKNMRQWAIEGTIVNSYFYVNGEGISVPNLKFNLRPEGTNTSAIDIEFGDFHRWVKYENFYRLHYYAVYPHDESINLEHVANMTLTVRNNSNAIYSSQR